VHYTSTFADHATLELRHGRRILARVRTEVAAGDGVLQVPTPPRNTRLRLTLTIRADDGRSAVAHLAVTTERRLTRAAALAIVRRIAHEDNDIGYYTEVGRCRRRGPRRVDCQSIRYVGGNGHYAGSCDGVYIARLRPDGIRVADGHGQRRCRRLGRRT
jgi:hypothetical protein